MKRIINGVPFHVISPSMLILDLTRESTRVRAAALEFTGREWLLTVDIRGGSVYHLPYPSRDAAIAAMGARA